MNSIMTFLKVMDNLVDAHRRLLDFAKEKRNILVDGNIQGLQSIILRESSCVDEIQKLEEQRKQFVKEYMNQKGIEGTNFSLDNLIQLETVDNIKTTLQSIAKQLRNLIQEITHLNECNQQLIHTSLSYVQYSIAMHVRKESAIGYGPNATNRYMNLLDAKI